jgi:hypothetical protein
MIKFTKFVALLSLLVLVPFTASAQETGGGLGGIITRISDLLGTIVPVLIGLGVVYLIWGVIVYFIADDEEAKTKGRDRIIFGIIGLAIIISIWGIVGILNQTLGLGSTDGLTGVGAPDVNLVVQAKGGDSCFGAFQADKKLSGLLNYGTCMIAGSVIPFIFAIAVVMFIWGAVQFFIINGGEEEKRTQGKQFMLWGLIALAVMISVWGIVEVFQKTFGVPTGVLPTVSPSK